jgi:hypothetical protein
VKKFVANLARAAAFAPIFVMMKTGFAPMNTESAPKKLYVSLSPQP